jgi:hypothetical protein
MLSVMTSLLSAPPQGTDLADRFRALDATGLELRTSDPGKVVSVYRTTPAVTEAVTALARVGRQALPQLGWTLEFSPAETVLVLGGPEDVLASLGLG